MSFPIGPDEEERLKVLLETGVLDPKQDPVLDSLCEEVRQHFGVPMCTITLLDRARQQIRAAQGLQNRRHAAGCRILQLYHPER